MRVTSHAKYPGKAPMLESTQAPLLLKKYSGRNHVAGSMRQESGRLQLRTLVNRPNVQVQAHAGKGTRGFTYAGMVLGSGEHAKLACNHWFKYIGR